jgi:hypothetical protein
LAACAAVDRLAAAVAELAAAVPESAAGAGCASVVGAAEAVEGDGLSGEKRLLLSVSMALAVQGNRKGCIHRSQWEWQRPREEWRRGQTGPSCSISYQ